MRIHSLTLDRFRSYADLRMDFSGDDVHVLVGENGVGKTNVLEAISILALTKSCIRADETDIIRWTEEYYRIRADVETDDGEHKTLEVFSQIAPRRQKACFRNDVRVSITEMIGTLPVVIFLPQDLELFTGAPAVRRALIDQLLSQVSPQYLTTLMQYGKVLRQRNSLLRAIADGVGRRGDLAVWDEKLAEAGAIITLRRMELIEMLQCTLVEELSSIGEHWPDAQMVYERKGDSRDFDGVKNEFLDLLSHFQERDIVVRSSTVGPHRDDWKILVDGRDIATFASRGQQRTAVLALLFLEVSYLELQRGEKPVILLDDVFSELDELHQQSLLKNLSGHQVIITATHVPENVHGAKVWDLQFEIINEYSNKK